MADNINLEDLMPVLAVQLPEAWYSVGKPAARKILRKVESGNDFASVLKSFEGGLNNDLPVAEILQAAVLAKITLRVYIRMRHQGVIQSRSELHKQVTDDAAVLGTARGFDWIKLIDAVVDEVQRLTHGRERVDVTPE